MEFKKNFSISDYKMLVPKILLKNLVRHRRRGFSMLLIILINTLVPNLMRSHIYIFLKSSENHLTIHAEDMKLIVDALLRRSH